MACYVSLLVGLSVGPSVRLAFDVYERFLRYCSCTPARDFGSSVYGFVDIETK